MQKNLGKMAHKGIRKKFSFHSCSLVNDRNPVSVGYKVLKRKEKIYETEKYNNQERKRVKSRVLSSAVSDPDSLNRKQMKQKLGYILFFVAGVIPQCRCYPLLRYLLKKKFRIKKRNVSFSFF